MRTPNLESNHRTFNQILFSQRVCKGFTKGVAGSHVCWAGRLLVLVSLSHTHTHTRTRTRTRTCTRTHTLFVIN